MFCRKDTSERYAHKQTWPPQGTFSWFWRLLSVAFWSREVWLCHFSRILWLWRKGVYAYGFWYVGTFRDVVQGVSSVCYEPRGGTPDFSSHSKRGNSSSLCLRTWSKVIYYLWIVDCLPHGSKLAHGLHCSIKGFIHLYHHWCCVRQSDYRCAEIWSVIPPKASQQLWLARDEYH